MVVNNPTAICIFVSGVVRGKTKSQLRLMPMMLAILGRATRSLSGFFRGLRGASSGKAIAADADDAAILAVNACFPEASRTSDSSSCSLLSTESRSDASEQIPVIRGKHEKPAPADADDARHSELLNPSIHSVDYFRESSGRWGCTTLQTEKHIQLMMMMMMMCAILAVDRVSGSLQIEESVCSCTTSATRQIPAHARCSACCRQNRDPITMSRLTCGDSEKE